MIMCAECYQDVTEYLTHNFTSHSGDTITVCDYCYQDFGTLKTVGDEWKEIIVIEGITYYKNNI
jgi:hypothetical protein